MDRKWQQKRQLGAHWNLTSGKMISRRVDTLTRLFSSSTSLRGQLGSREVGSSKGWNFKHSRLLEIKARRRWLRIELEAAVDSSHEWPSSIAWKSSLHPLIARRRRWPIWGTWNSSRGKESGKIAWSESFSSKQSRNRAKHNIGNNSKMAAE